MLPENRFGRFLRPPPPPESVRCTVGDTLCYVHIWSQEEWERIAPNHRPSCAEYFPGLGWVGAVLGSKR